jgi:hypothetical protein
LGCTGIRSSLVSDPRPGAWPPYPAARAALAVASARLRSQPVRPALVVAGVALAFAMLVSVLGGSLVARQQALGRALAGVPESARGLRVDRFGLPLNARADAQEDALVRRAVATVSAGGIRRVVFFRQLRVQGELVEIAAVDDLAQVVRLRSGRLPRTCTKVVCEMLQIGGGGTARLAEGEVRLRRVGIADLRDRTLFGYISAAARGGATRPTLLLGPSVDALQRLDALTPFYRVDSWLSTLRAGGLRTWDIRRLLAAESRVQAVLYAADPAFRLSSPDDALLEAERRGEIAASRLVLVGGETSALLLGFAIIAAIGLRRGLESERRRLLARGARRWQIGLAVGAEIGSMTLAGALAGIAAGTIAVAAIAATAGLPVGPILGHTLFAGWTVATLVGGWLATTLLLALTTFAKDDETGQRRVRLVDVAAIGAGTTIAVALSRGALDPDSVSSGNTVLLLILPGLVCFVVAVVLARLLAPAMRLAERLTRERSASLRLAVLALARAPARTVVSCAFVAVALGLALFAASYRATLDRGAADQAAFEVPLDFALSEGSRLVLPLDAAPLARYEQLGDGTRAYPVVRVSATTVGSGSSVLSPTVLGVPADAVARLRWRSDFSSLPLQTIAARLAPQGEPRLAGVALPAGTTTLSIAVRLHGSDLLVGLVVADDGGRTKVLPLGEVRQGSGVVSAKLRRATHEQVLGLQFRLPEREAFFLAHRETEGEVSRAPSGVLELGPLRAGSGTGAQRLVTSWGGWLLPAGGRVAPKSDRAEIRFAFRDTGARLVFRPREPTDGRFMPVVVSPDIAQAAGGVGKQTVLDFQSTTVAARIVGVARRMPTVPSDSGPFVLADSGWLSTAIAANAPGEGRPTEIWLSASHERAAVEAALGRPPFSSLVVASRTHIERQLASDPLAHATAFALAAAGIVALALAVVGFWIGIVSELRDERSDFFDLEAQGVPPESLRSQLRTRGLILVGIGLAAGAGLGALLSQLVVSLVRVSATTSLPEPALRFEPAWFISGMGILTLAAAALLVAEGTSLVAFRSARPTQASWSLE